MAEEYEVYEQKCVVSIAEQFINWRYVLLTVSQSFAPSDPEPSNSNASPINELFKLVPLVSEHMPTARDRNDNDI